MDTMSTQSVVAEFTILGEPASKANSRQIVMLKGRPAVIKSKKARDYVKTFQMQCPVLKPLIEGDVCAEIQIFYASRRPDLDESVILDCMQSYIYANDRQVKRKIISWGLDRDNPRSVIKITPLKDS